MENFLLLVKTILGQLGVGDKIDKTSPTEITSMRSNVKEVLTSSLRSLVFTKEKKLFISGYKTGADTPNTFTEIVSLRGKVERIFGGKSSNFVLTTDKKLFAFGQGTFWYTWFRK